MAFSFPFSDVYLIFIVELSHGAKPFQFLLSVKYFISLSHLNKSLAIWIILGFRFLAFIIFNIKHYSLFAYRVSAEKSADSIMRAHLFITCCFLLAAYIVPSLIFTPLITLCLDMIPLGLSVLYSLCFLYLYVCFLSQVGGSFT